jgi:hypothetical protein
VEKVLQRKVKDGIELLLIKWEGYDDPSDWTWEPATTMRADIPGIVGEFEDSQSL